jgi:L-threonylcarbamoyladenylate synthase
MTAKIGEQQMISEQDARALQECIAGGGVAVFPTDTVYGVCCDPDNEQAARRLYALKGRPAARPAAIMFFALEPALQTLSELALDERTALSALLPGPVTLLLANPALRFAPACRIDPATLGLRVPDLPASLQALASLAMPVMQSSANLSGEPDACSLAQVPKSMRDGADLVLDGGELPGRPSTVIDLRDYREHRRWHVLREGALARSDVRETLTSLA